MVERETVLSPYIRKVFKCSKEFFNVTLFFFTGKPNYGSFVFVLFFFLFLPAHFYAPSLYGQKY